MAQADTGFPQSPFRSVGAPGYFHERGIHEEAMARLEFLVDQRRRVGIVLGGEGVGKSLLLGVFARRLRTAGHPVALVNTRWMSPLELLADIAGGLGVATPPDAPYALVWRRLTDRLTELRYEQRHAVILLDDADLAKAATVEQIVRLVQWESAAATHHSTILTGRPERIGQLGERLLELAELRIDLAPWDSDQMRQFVERALAEAGRSHTVFDEGAFLRLHALSDGVPRRVCQLADLALLAGAAHGAEPIDSSTIDSVYRELGVIEV